MIDAKEVSESMRLVDAEGEITKNSAYTKSLRQSELNNSRRFYVPSRPGLRVCSEREACRQL